MSFFGVGVIGVREPSISWVDSQGVVAALNTGVSPLRPSASGRDDELEDMASGPDDELEAAAFGRDDGLVGEAAPTCLTGFSMPVAESMWGLEAAASAVVVLWAVALLVAALAVVVLARAPLLAVNYLFVLRY